MLKLHDEFEIGRGRRRSVYRHPHHPDRCLKVTRDPAFAYISEKEARYAERFRRLNPKYDYRSLPRYYGWLETNLGPASVFERIRNPIDESPSLDIKAVLRFEDNEGVIDDLIIAFRHWRADVRRWGILGRDLHLGNFMVRRRRDGELDLVLIDGVGHSDAVPVADYWTPLMRRRVTKYIRRFGLDDDRSVRGQLESFRRRVRRVAVRAA